MPAYREPQWDEERTSRSSLHFASAPRSAQAAARWTSFPAVDRLIYLDNAFKIAMTDVAKTLGDNALAG